MDAPQKASCKYCRSCSTAYFEPHARNIAIAATMTGDSDCGQLAAITFVTYTI